MANAVEHLVCLFAICGCAVVACPVASSDFLTELFAFPLLSSECCIIGAGP